MYQFPFGQQLHPLVQQDRSTKQVFVLGGALGNHSEKWNRLHKVWEYALKEL